MLYDDSHLILRRAISQYHTISQDYQKKGFSTLFAIGLQLTDALQGKTADPLKLTGVYFDEDKDIAQNA